jgi:fructose-1,6-bisphosphatase/inositol monophosphatase family enzyme
MIDIDTQEIATIIREVAAEHIIPKFKNLTAAEIREKKPGDFVTDADENSERALSAALREILSGSTVVGEEAVSKDVNVLNLLSSDRPIWVIDPIDGTYNFSHGRSCFGVLLSLVKNGVTRYSWCYDIPGKRMGIAVKGQGATINGEKAQVRRTAQSPAEMSGMVGGSQAWHFDQVRGHVKEIKNMRCAMFDFMSLAAGEADFVFHPGRLTPWDHAATVLLAEEAGAYVRLADENIEFHPDMYRRAMLLAAADFHHWKELEEIFITNFKFKSST